MSLKFFNTLSRKKEVFVPLRKGEVRMYNCGPTVYDYAHIGNLRSYCFADLVRRWLERRGYRVTQIMNVTDVDDKTIKGARTAGVPLREFTARFENAFFEDLDSLGIEKAAHYPRATEHVPEMVALIEKLLEKGLAYKGADGSVYYRIAAFKDYGSLSKTKLRELKQGAGEGRVSADEYEKQEARDFALWKARSPDDGGVFWKAPFGEGRPGWHIECSAMSAKYLGEPFDVHTGGVDLIFPHHENEIAQSEGASGKRFVRYWLHCEHLLVDGAKMAKRFHNFFTLRDIAAKGFSPKALRFLLVSTHYRSQLNFTFASLRDSENALARLNEFVSRLGDVKAASARKENKGLARALGKARKDFVKAMDDDLDVARALAAVHSLVGKANKALGDGLCDEKTAQGIRDFMRNDFGAVFGVLSEAKPLELSEEVARLVREREEARRRKDFARADAIRETLRKKGFALEDSGSGGVRVKRIR